MSDITIGSNALRTTIQLRRNRNRAFIVTCRVPDTEDAFDLTNWTPAMQARIALRYDDDPVLDLAVGTGIEYEDDDPTLGILNVTITAAMTAATTWTRAEFDLIITNGDDVHPLLEGIVVVSDGATA